MCFLPVLSRFIRGANLLQPLPRERDRALIADIERNGLIPSERRGQLYLGFVQHARVVGIAVHQPLGKGRGASLDLNVYPT